ncbi:hypothetical protein AR691_19925 [Bacillus amyloliquefaciens]|nr:hypothetical protein AR691_19925 [Bacillus amyloliquefaciens]
MLRKKGRAMSIHPQLKMLLLTTSAIVAARPGMEDFALTADEAEQICTPLANIMAKSEGVAGVASEYGRSYRTTFSMLHHLYS